MKNVLLLFFIFYSSGVLATICVSTNEYRYEKAIDNARHIFIAQITSVRVKDISEDRTKVFEIEFEILDSLKKSKQITFNVLTEKEYSTQFNPGFAYLVFTNDGKVESGCSSNTIQLSGNYPIIFEHEDFHIKSLKNYIEYRTPIDTKKMIDLYEEYYEGCHEQQP